MASIEDGDVNEPLTGGGESPQHDGSSIWVRMRLTEQVMKLRATHDGNGNEQRPKTWRAIGKQLGISYETARGYYADGLKWGEPQPVMDFVDMEIAFRERILVELSNTYSDARKSNPSAAVGALRLMLDVSHERILMMQAAGRIPRNLARFRQEADWTAIVREMMSILERNGIGGEVLLEMRNLVRRHAPDHAHKVDNVVEIGSARSADDS